MRALQSPGQAGLLRRLDGPGQSIAMVFAALIPVFVILSRSVTEGVIGGLAFGFLLHLAATRDLSALRAPWFLVAMAYWGWIIITTLLAGARWEQMEAALAWGRFPLAMLAIATWALASARAGRIALWALGGAVAFVALEVWLQFLFGHGLTRPGDDLVGYFSGPFLRPRAGGYLSVALWPVLLPALAALLGWRWKGRLGACLLVALALGAVFLAGQRSPMLMTGAGLAAAALVLRPLRLPVVFAALAAAALLAAASLFAPVTFYRYVVHLPELLANFPETHYGQIVGRALAMHAAHPWLGLGADGFRIACYNPAYHIGWGGVGNGGGALMCVTHAHHFYLEALVNGGWPGLILFTAFCVLVLVAMGRGLWRGAAAPDPVRVGLLLAAGISLWPVATAGAFAGIDQAALRCLVIGLGLAAARRADEGTPRA
jgi:O-antigen ligase